MVTRFSAEPDPGYVFVAWEGACDALENPCSRVFEDGDTITATFALHALRLDLTGDGEGAFRIAGGPIDVTCDDDCGVALEQPLLLLISYERQGTTGTDLGAWGGDCVNATAANFCYVTASGATDVSKAWRHPPVAFDDPDDPDDPAYRTVAGTPLVVAAPRVLANDDDSHGDVLQADLFDDVEHGTLVLDDDGGFTYTADPAHVGPQTFTYQARDAFGNLSNFAKVTITVEPHEIGGLTVTPTTATLDVDDTVTLTVDFTDVIGDPNLSVTWNSNNNDVATVTPTSATTAEVTAITPGGPITITVTSNFDPSKPAEVTITVNEDVILTGRFQTINATGLG